MSKNPNLDNINFQDNNINTLNLQHNPNLTFIDCSNNLLSTLDLFDLENLNTLSCVGNINLYVVCINQSQITESQNWTKSSYTEWNAKCRQPKPDMLYFNDFNTEPKTDRILSDISGFVYFEDDTKTFDRSGLLKGNPYTNTVNLKLYNLPVADYDPIII